MAVDLDLYEDPSDPPPGYRAVPCPGCSAPGVKPTATRAAAAGPIRGELCIECNGRTWVWWRLNPIN